MYIVQCTHMYIFYTFTQVYVETLVLKSKAIQSKYIRLIMETDYWEESNHRFFPLYIYRFQY